MGDIFTPWSINASFRAALLGTTELKHLISFVPEYSLATIAPCYSTILLDPKIHRNLYELGGERDSGE